MEPQVLRYFSQQHLNVSSEWVKACVQFIQSQTNPNSAQAMIQACRDQWLATDIRENGVQDGKFVHLIF